MSARGTITITFGVGGNPEIINTGTVFNRNNTPAFPSTSYTIESASIQWVARNTYGKSNGDAMVTEIHAATVNGQLLGSVAYGGGNYTVNGMQVNANLITNYDYTSLTTLCLKGSGGTSMQLYGAKGNIVITLNYRQNSGTITYGSNRIEAGGTQTYTIGNYSSDYSYSLDILFGTQHKIISIATGGGATGSFGINMDYLSQIPSRSELTVTSTLTTYSGSTSLGSQTGAFTMTVPASAKPVIQNDAVTVTVNKASANTTDVECLQGYATVTVTLDQDKVTKMYGTSISSVYIDIGNTRYQASTATSGTLTTAGDLSIKVTVYDGRGLADEQTKVQTVTAYTPPTLQSVSAVRYNPTTHVVQDTGLKAQCSASYSWSNVDGNALTLKVKQGSTEAYSGTPSSGSTFVTNQSTDFAITSAYRLEFVLSDKVTSSTLSINLPASGVFMSMNPASNKLGIGTYAQNSNSVEIKSDWSLYVHGDQVDDRYRKADYLPSGDDAQSWRNALGVNRIGFGGCTAGSSTAAANSQTTVTATATVPEGFTPYITGWSLYNASHYNFYPQGIGTVSVSGTTATFSLPVLNRLTSSQTAYCVFFYVLVM